MTTPTPRTDAAEINCITDASLLREMRKLETELAEARRAEDAVIACAKQTLTERDAAEARAEKAEAEAKRLFAVIESDGAFIAMKAERDELRAEVEAYRNGGVTEEILRRQDGHVKVGNGCCIVAKQDYDQLRAEVERLHDSAAFDAAAKEALSNEIATLRAEVESLKKALADSCDEHRSVYAREGGATCPLDSELAAAKEDAERLLGFAELTMRGLAQGHIRASPFMDMSDPNATEWPMRFLADECAEVISKSIRQARKEESK